MTPIDEIRARLAACPIPDGAVADWDGTNHYEVVTPIYGEYWWLKDLPELFGAHAGHEDWSGIEVGKRLGACMDYACAYRPDITALLAEIDDLRNKLTQAVAKLVMDEGPVVAGLHDQVRRLQAEIELKAKKKKQAAERERKRDA